MDFKSACAF